MIRLPHRQSSASNSTADFRLPPMDVKTLLRKGHLQIMFCTDHFHPSRRWGFPLDTRLDFFKHPWLYSWAVRRMYPPVDGHTPRHWSTNKPIHFFHVLLILAHISPTIHRSFIPSPANHHVSGPGALFAYNKAYSLSFLPSLCNQASNTK